MMRWREGLFLPQNRGLRSRVPGDGGARWQLPAPTAGFTIRGTEYQVRATDLAVGFTRYQAERNVCQVRSSCNGHPEGCWKTWRAHRGLTGFAIVQSYLSTAAKWGVSKLNALRELFTTGEWVP
jgi:hypothetical protein